jgi:hypothetical protein
MSNVDEAVSGGSIVKLAGWHYRAAKLVLCEFWLFFT